LTSYTSSPEGIGLATEQIESLKQLSKEAIQLIDSKTYTLAQRRKFVGKALKHFIPVLATVDESYAKNGEALLFMGKMHAEHGDLLIEMYRDLVRHLIQNKPGLFKDTKFKREAYDVGDREISFIKREDGLYQLHVFVIQVGFNFQMEGLIFKHGHVRTMFSTNRRFTGCVGDKEELIDFCLLKWRQNVEDESYAKIWRRILNKVSEQSLEGGYDDWLNLQMRQKNIPDENEWVFALLSSGHPSVRCAAIGSLGEGAGQYGLLALVDILEDPSRRWSKEYVRSFDGAFTSYVQDYTDMRQTFIEGNSANTTMASKAKAKLQELTEQDFGQDAQAWQKWIRANVK